LFFLIFEFIIISMIYYDVVIWVMKFIQSVVACDNYDDFHHVNFIFFEKKLLHYFDDYLMMKLSLG
jgi:hypothetical protein